MIIKYTTSQNQTWFDLAIQLLGNPDSAISLANYNGYSILNNPLENTEIQYETNALPSNFTGFDNSANDIVSTAPNIYITVNSFSNDFNLNEFF